MFTKKSIFFYLLLGVIFIQSCVSHSDLADQFNCDKHVTFHSLERVTDFQNNFSIQVPKDWKTKLYYDAIQSEIFCADTLKSLTESYIMDFSMVYATIKINDSLKIKVNNKISKQNLEELNSFFHTFKGNPSFTQISKGVKNGYPFQLLQSYIKVTNSKYLLINTEFYGEEFVEERLCNAIHLIEKIKIINTTD